MDDVNISYDIQNINVDEIIEEDSEPEVDVFVNVRENYNTDQENMDYYVMVEALDETSVEDTHRTLYDRYWKKFYNEKAENYDTDMMALRFS